MGQGERVQRPPSDGDSSHVVSSGSSGESGYCQPRGEGGGSDSMGTQEGGGPRPGQKRAAQLACRRYDCSGGRKGARAAS